MVEGLLMQMEVMLEEQVQQIKDLMEDLLIQQELQITLPEEEEVQPEQERLVRLEALVLTEQEV